MTLTTRKKDLIEKFLREAYWEAMRLPYEKKDVNEASDNIRTAIDNVRAILD